MSCTLCRAQYPVIDSIPVLSTGLSPQHLHQREYFDAEFSEYDEYVVENWRLSFIDRIFTALRVLDGGEPYLDVGVGGSGATVIEAARRVSAAGCDLSIPGILRARDFARQEGVGERCSFAVCAAEQLPYEDNSMGSASAVALLEHLDDDRAALGEIARVTRPGARVWVTVPHAFRHIPPPLWPVYWWHDRRIGHKRHYSARRLWALGAEVGLQPVRTTYSGHPVKVAQFGLELLSQRLRKSSSSLWWKLERLDRRAERRPLGALQLNVVFERRR